MDKAMLTEYDTAILVDASGSMAAPVTGFASRWAQAQEMTIGIAGLAQQVDDDGVTLIAFGGAFNPETDVVDGVRMEAVAGLFASRSPHGGTPMDRALAAAFAKKFAAGKKMVIFVITDGEPDSKPAVETAIRTAAAKIPDASHIRILFLQVGDDPASTKYLNSLDTALRGIKFDIVNAVDFTAANGLAPDALYERAIMDTH